MKLSDSFFSVQQVSRQCDIPKLTLRFWEKKFADILVPVRSHGGQRRYSARHLELIGKIKQLKEQGLSLGAIRQAIADTPIEKRSPEIQLEKVADQVASLVRQEVFRLLMETLNP